MAGQRPRLSSPHKPMTPAQLDASAAITSHDIAHAANQWKKDAPPAFRSLLDATEQRPEHRRKRGTADSGSE